MEKPKINLFISYGHEKRNARIVRALMEALENRGFRLWIDWEKIPTGTDWRREIVRGINETDLTLGFLSQYSTRARGVCLDELGISVSVPGRKLITVLLESQRKVSLPSTITREQWVDLSQWRKYIGTDRWDAYFSPRIDQIAASVENPDNYNFQGEITALRRVLRPEPFDRRAMLYISNGNSVPRPQLIERVNEWIQSPSSGRFLLITGDAGTGKSHFSAVFQHYNPTCAAGAFCEHGKVSAHYVKDLVRFLSYILATKYPDYRYQLLNLFREQGLTDNEGAVREQACAEFFENRSADALFDFLFGVRMIGGFGTNLAIVLDALDEASDGEKNPLLDFLCGDRIAALPPHFKFVVTSRAEPAIMARIAAVRPSVIDLDRKACDADIERYIRARLNVADSPHSLTDAETAILVDRCAGMFLYAELLCDALLANPGLTAEKVSRMPGGLGGLFCGYFDRLFPKDGDYERVKPFLRIICAYDIGNLSEEFLLRAAGAGREELNRFYQTLRTFARRVTADGRNCVTLFHKSLYDWLTDREACGKYFIDIDAGRRGVMEMCAAVIAHPGPDERHEILKSVYLYTKRHGDAFGVRAAPAFLYALLNSAFNNSDFPLFLETVERIEKIAAFTGDKRLYVLSQFELASWYYDSADENEKALELIEKLYRDHRDLIDTDPEVHASAEINRIYVVSCSRKEYKETWQQADELVRYILSKKESELPSRGIYLARAYYHRCMIEYRDEQYQAAIESADLTIETAEYAYTDPRKMKCLVWIVQGNAYAKTDLFDRAMEVLERSLEYRLALYDRFSLFVANAYSNLVKTLFRKAVRTGTPVDPRAYAWLEAYREAITVSVGKKNSRMIQYHYYLAQIAEYEQDYPKALEHAGACLRFEERPSTAEQIETARRIIREHG